MQIGYFLASEEYSPRELIEQAKQAEQAGFHALWISDHYHPWNDEQGHSAFVWSVIGALAEATSLPVTTGVTCPTVRIHPAVIAQAAATSGVLHEGRFALGVGSGEALNEHILGDHWPEADVRLEMLEEAVEVIRTLWQGGQQSHHGRHYTVENARVYDLPERAAADPRVRLRAEGDQARREDRRRVRHDVARQGRDRPLPLRGREGPGARRHQGLLTARTRTRRARPCTGCGRTRRCPASSPRSCRRRAHFEQACELVTPEQLATPVGPDLDQHAESLKAYEDAGVDELFVQQIGPEQDLFFAEWAPEILKRF